MNKFEKEYYLKNKLGRGMTYQQAIETLEFAKKNNLVDDMVDIYKKADLLNRY